MYISLHSVISADYQEEETMSGNWNVWKNCDFLSVDSRMNDGIEGCFEPTLFIKQCSSDVWNFVQVAQS